MSSESVDNVVYRRYNKGRVHKDVTKRVSFGENALVDSKIKELKILHRADEIKSDQLDLELLKKSINTCYEAEKYDFGKRKEDNIQSAKRLLSGSKISKNLEYLLLSERGSPEGQEDPERYSSTNDLTENSKDLTAKNVSKLCRPMYCVSCERNNYTKSMLIKRFLMSISERNVCQHTLPQDKSRITSLYIKNVKPSELPDYSVVLDPLLDEIKMNTRNEVNVVSTLNPLLSKLVTLDINSIYKVYKVLTVEGCPVLAVITADLFCLISYCPDTKAFAMNYSCSFENLLAAVLGPFSQLVIILNDNKNQFFINTGLADSVAADLISHLEISLRRWCKSNKRQFNFSVATINDLKSMTIFHSILPDDAFLKDETLIAQYSIWLQEDYVETSSALELRKEGYLMTKIGIEVSWSPSFVCLKNGVLNLFGKSCEPIPKFAIPLGSNIYKGCHILNNLERPYTFEIILEGNSTFNFGAANEEEMMEWIRDLHSTAIQVSNLSISDDKQESPLVSCFATLTTTQILLHRFPNHIISRALLSDVSSFTKSSWPNNYYCILDLCCREASEMGGDWILYFVSEALYKNFCLKFRELTKHLSVKYQYENAGFVKHKSDRICEKIQSSWNSFFV